MYFCPFCCNLLVTEHQQSVMLVCVTCPYSYKLSSTLTFAQKGTMKAVEVVVDEDDALKNANKCQVKCPKCSHEEALFVELQTRSADEPMTIFYQCIKCKFNWKE